MNCSSQSAVREAVSGDVDEPFFAPVGAPLVFDDPFVLIVPDQKYGMVDLGCRFARKGPSSVVLPVICAYGNHDRTLLEQVDDLAIPDIVIGKTGLAPICVLHVASSTTANSLVSLLGLVR